MTHTNCHACRTSGHSTFRDLLELPLVAIGVALVVYGAITGRLDVPFGGGMRWRSK